jgi:hypothetical protein
MSMSLLSYGPYNTGGGSGGRIAVYSSSYSYSGSFTAFGGSGPSTSSNAAAGTIYLETGNGAVFF